MPSIKLKKKTAEYLAEKERESEKAKLDEAPVAEPEPEPITQPKKDDMEKKSKGLLKGLGSEIIIEKRKRTIPLSEQRLIDWVEENIENHEDCHLVMNRLYQLFCEFCQAEGDTQVADIGVLERIIHQKFGKTYAVKELSPYFKKIKLVKSGPPKTHTYTGSTGTSKSMREIVTEAIEGCGNTSKGVSFRHLKMYVISHYPAVRVDLVPSRLKQALERGLYFRHVELAKGVGLCGYYRLPGAPEVEDEKEKIKKEKKRKKSEVTENGDAGENDSSGEKVEHEGENGDAPPKKKRKKKKEKEEKEKEENEGGEESKENEENSEKKKKKRSKRKGDKKKKWFQDSAYGGGQAHCNPKTIENAFPLAITYGCEPKEASILKIRGYIEKFYPSISEEKLKKAIEKGVDDHLFQLVSGHASNGSYRLLVNEFNPEPSEDYEDRVCQAIIGCCDPKIASAVSIKGYIQEYHEKFDVERHPKKFKSALIRAANKGVIRQVSGIGATGSFQLMKAFLPSPYVLAGQEDIFVEEKKTSFKMKDDEEFKELYVPRATKSGRTGRISTSWEFYDASSPAPRKAPKDRSKPTVRKPHFEKPEGEKAEKSKRVPSKAKKTAKSRGRKQTKKAAPKPKTESVEEVEEDEEVEEVKEVKKINKRKPLGVRTTRHSR